MRFSCDPSWQHDNLKDFVLQYCWLETKAFSASMEWQLQLQNSERLLTYDEDFCGECLV